jgi:hypothetical protein
LPHIGNSKCIKFVLQRFCLTILKIYPFLVEICMGGTLRSLQFCPWFQKLLPNLPSDIFSGDICLTKFKILPFLDGICMGGTLAMSNFKILSIFFLVFGPQYRSQKCHQKCSRVKFATKLKDFIFLSQNLYEGYPWDGKLYNSDLSIFFRFLDLNIVTKNAVRCVLG